MEFLVKDAMEQAEQMPTGSVGHANIKVIGCGGAGNNMVGWLYKKGVKGAEIFACNTDTQHLEMTSADKKFLMGRDSTRGLGCVVFQQKEQKQHRNLFRKSKIL